MDFDRFAQGKKDCHASENGFLMWRLTGGELSAPCPLDGGGSHIAAHILMCRGELRIDHDGVEYMLTAGDFSTLLDHSRLSLLWASPDIVAYVMVMDDVYSHALLKNNPPVPYTYVLKMRQNPVLTPGAELFARLRRRMEGIMEACADTGNLFRDKMIKCAIWMFLLDIADRHIQGGGRRDPDAESDRAMRMFVDFLRLLPTNVATQHFAAFYAGRLCVTTQYLNRIVKSLSGRTVTGWINFTLVGEVSRRLEDTRDTMQQIATDLGFPDQATLTKFFKRETGYSLTGYRKLKGGVKGS